MKKITLLLMSLFCAVAVSNAQEITYVEDPSQGLLINDTWSNCFISVEAGTNMLFSPNDKNVDFGKRFGFSVNGSLGKWFTPVFGVRGSLDYTRYRGGVNPATGRFVDYDDVYANGIYGQKINQAGARIDLMANLTNGFCGYKADRVYNAILYAGASGNFLFDTESYSGCAFGVQLGLLNKFAVSKSFDLLLDVRANMYQHGAETGNVSAQFDGGVDVLVGFAYNFSKRDWSAPIVPVCPEYKYTDAEGDALVARLAAADNKIVDVETQLKETLARPVEVIEVVEDTKVATLYYKIGSSSLTSVNVNAVKAIAAAMKANEDQKYVITGWADSYTGSAKWNAKLSENRANAVARVLKAQGVSDDQYEVKVGEKDLTAFGVKAASLDRAVTIDIAE